MNEPSPHNDFTDTVPAEQPSDASTNTALTNHEDLEKRPLRFLPQEVGRLYTWFGFLTGLSVLLISILIGFIVLLIIKQNQLERQISSLIANKVEVNRVRSLEAQVKSLSQQTNSLNKQVPKGLPSQLKTMQGQLKQLQAVTKKVESDVVARNQENEILRKALESRNTRP
jgi:cell division protein FtsB